MEVKKHKLKAFTSVLCLVFCCFLLVFAVFKFKVLSVQTGSMSPTLNVGDYLLITPKNEYAVGDVVAFEYDGLIITHRIVKIEGESYILKGDNANLTQTIKKSAILGQAKKINKFFKFLIDFRFILLIPISISLYIFIKNIYLCKKHQ